MSPQHETGILGIFTELDATTVAIERLRKAGMRDMVVFSPMPRHEIEHALQEPESPVRMFTLVGALTGTATGFALPIWTSLDWPLITGGKPIISLPPFVIIAFELTILFGALSTILGLFITARLPRMGGRMVYDPAFSAGKFGVFVVPVSGREAEARAALSESGALEVRERPEEVRVALD
jgi:hypothetical protein